LELGSILSVMKTDREHADEAERDLVAAVRALTDLIESVRDRPGLQQWSRRAHESIDAAQQAVGMLRANYDPENGPYFGKPLTFAIVIANMRKAERTVRDMREAFVELTSGQAEDA